MDAAIAKSQSNRGFSVPPKLIPQEIHSGDVSLSDGPEVPKLPDHARLFNVIKSRKRVRTRLTRGGIANLILLQELEQHLKPVKNYTMSAPRYTTTMAHAKSLWGRGIIRVTHEFRIKWDLFVMGLAIWNVFCIPYTLVFDISFAERLEVVIINLSIDFIFFLDVLFTFRTTYHHAATGDEIRHPGQIARNYLFGKFWIDAITCIPNDIVDLFYTRQSQEVSTRNVIALLGILKLYRISRLNRIINFMRAKSDVKLASRILQLILFLVMYLHLLCCGWWIVARYDEEWVPSSGDTSLYTREISYIYWTTFYAAVQMLVGGELSPRTTLQASFSAIMIFCGAFINAVMFGSMALLMSNLNIRQTKFQETQTVVNTAMKNMRLPEALQQKISDYLICTQATMASSEEFETFRALISPSLYNEVLQCIYGELIRENAVVATNEQARAFILQKLKPQFCKPEEVLVMQHEPGQSLYFVACGTCQVSVCDEKRQNHVVSYLKPGAHFGEVALLTIGLRTATVRAFNYSTLAVLDFDNFNHVIQQWPDFRTSLRHGMHQYNDCYKRFLKNMIRKRVPMLGELKPRTYQELVYSMKIERLEEGEYLVKPGMTTEKMWFVAEGEIEASVTICDEELNYQRIILHSLGKHCQMQRKPHWRLPVPIAESTIMPYTAIYPTCGALGIDSSLHATDIDTTNRGKLLGKKCVEILLDSLKVGSQIGALSVLTNEIFSIQAKAVKKCTLYTLDKHTFSQLRKTCPDLHEALKQVELQHKIFIPHLDDYQIADDPNPDFVHEFNARKWKCRFRGLILRIIKDNRDKTVLETPMIALMLKNIKSSTLSRKVSALKLKFDSDEDMKRVLLKESFNPKNWKKLSNAGKREQPDDIALLKAQFFEQKEMIQDLKEQMTRLTICLSRGSTLKLGEAEEETEQYQTTVFVPNKS